MKTPNLNSGITLSCALLLGLFHLTPTQAQEIKVATVAPDGSGWMREMRAGAEVIRERSEGRVTIKFYPGGIMGNDSQVLRKIRVGQLQGGAFTGGGLGERYSGFNIYGIPLLFRSLDEVDYVRERLDADLEVGLREAGFTSFGFIEGGFAQMMANEPISSIDDMRRRKVWSPEGDPIGFRVLEAMGLSPVVLPPTDVLTGLQTGLLDVVAASTVVALVLQWHTKVKYVTDLPIAYALGIFAIDNRVFDRLSAADQELVRGVMSGVMASLDAQTRTDNLEAEAVLRDAGIEFVPVHSDQIPGWRTTIEGLYTELRERRDIDADLLDKLLAILEEYRAGAGSPTAQLMEHRVTE
ncbi:MAG: TRAP transporter substrate-binding protein DctP [Candidatus Rariloculaceae bacterium]